MTLWELGVQRLKERHGEDSLPKERPGVTINRQDVLAVPVPSVDLLWRNLHLRDAFKSEGRQETKHVRIEIILEGIANSKEWSFGLEFDYSNAESFHCRPLQREGENLERIPAEANDVHVAFLPPMSGLAGSENRLDPGAINVSIGEGRTAEVLRNLCYQVYEEHKDRWGKIVERMEDLFNVTLKVPEYIPSRGEVVLTYKEVRQRKTRGRKTTDLDISSSGRGLQQTLLLLTYMHMRPGSVLLLDEPDAHLEILRQREIYDLLQEVASESGNQILAASHSEVLLNEARETDLVIAFLGKPHRIDDRGSQLAKALKGIRQEDYLSAKEKGWVLYLEGSSDRSILLALAHRMKNEAAQKALEETPFVIYVGNNTRKAKDHFHGLREACPALKGVALFDCPKEKCETKSNSNDVKHRTKSKLDPDHIEILMWKCREIENYLCYPETLEAYARNTGEKRAAVPLFSWAEEDDRAKAMRKAIDEVMKEQNERSPWDDPTMKASDDFLAPLFEKYFQTLKLPNVMAKTHFHNLAQYVPKDKISPEVKEKLEAIAHIAEEARQTKGTD